MDIKKDERKCGNCADWKGPREELEDCCIKVKASARGKCERLDKMKPAAGGCQHWKSCWEEEEG